MTTKSIAFMIVIFSVFVGCASNTDRAFRENSNDGIIYLNEERQSNVKIDNESSNIDSKQAQKKKDNEKLRNFRKDDGIIYLGYSEQANEQPGRPIERARYFEEGKASFYADKFHGRRTASGEIYDQNKLTAAHPTLKFGTRVRVTNLFNNKSVIVRINDRGPALKSRIIDLSYEAAKRLDMIENGVVQVRIEVVGQY